MSLYQRIRGSWRLVRRVLAALGLLLVAFFALAPTGRYLVRGAWAEGHILARRRSIADIIADPATRPEVASKLRLVLAARAFAADSIGLNARQSFTTYSRLDRDTLVLVLSGAHPDRLEPYTWWFPIVGRVPYKGYFDFAAARAARRTMAAEGYDVYLRPSPAFSTLGWFNDPLLSTTLRGDSASLANTVIHELTHNTYYAPGDAVFNESFASFVGARGSAWFFRSRGLTHAADVADARWADDKALARFWARLYRRIDSAFAAHPNDSLARLTARDSVYASARRRLVTQVAPTLRSIAPRALERIPLDNAALLAHRIYATDLDAFDAVWWQEEGNLPKTVERIIAMHRRHEWPPPSQPPPPARPPERP